MNKIKYCGNPKVFARKIAEKYNLKATVDIFEFAKQLNLKIYWIDKLENKQGDEAWGKLYFDEKSKENRIVLSRAISYPNSTRSTLANGIAHFLIDGEKTTKVMWKVRFMFDPEERKYNIFATNLLIPDEQEYERLRQEKNKSQLANYYGVPITSIEMYEENNYGV